MSLLSRAWSRVGPIREAAAEEAAPERRRGYPLSPPTFFAETGPEVADAEYLVTESLADLTVKLGDPWAAAQQMFGGRS